MRKKIAILLAAVMTLSLLPMNLFAASTNTLQVVSTVIPEYSMIAETGARFDAYRQLADGTYVFDTAAASAAAAVAGLPQGVFGTNAPSVLTDQNTVERVAPREVSSQGLNIGNIRYLLAGADFRMILNDTVKDGDRVRLKLENAKWFFRNIQNSTPANTGIFNGLNPEGRRSYNLPASTNNYALSGDHRAPMFTLSYPTAAGGNANYTFRLSTNYNVLKGFWTPTASGNTDGVYVRDFGGEKLSDLTVGNGIDTNGTILPSWTKDVGTVAAPNMVSVTTNHAYATNGKYYAEVGYTLEVSPLDDTVAVLTIKEDRQNTAFGGLNIVVVPLVVRTTAANDLKINVTDSTNLTSLSTGVYYFGTASGTLTTTSVSSIQTARNEWKVENLIIRENRVSSIHTGQVFISAPNGFHWANPAAGTTSGDLISVFTETGLSWGYSGKTGAGTRGYEAATVNGVSTMALRDWELSWKPIYYYSSSNSYYDYVYYNGGARQYAGWYGYAPTTSSAYQLDQYDDSVLLLSLNVNTSTDIAGSIYIKGLVLYADENAAWGDVMLNISNVDSSRLVVTEQSFKGAVRNDWTTLLSTEGTIPELINGRYERDYDISASNKDLSILSAMLNSVDVTHKTARVVFSENSVASWWAGRETIFTLPEGVKFRKVYVTSTSELANDGDTVMRKTDYYKDVLGYVGGGVYLNDGKKHGYVTIDGNKMTWTNMSVNANKRATIKFDSWVTVQSGFVGDVTMTVSGSAIPEQPGQVASVKIATQISPVTIATKVSDLKIGYQYQATADVEITETKAGNLQVGKQVLITVSDLISTDMLLTPETKVEVVTANQLKISNISSLTSGYASRNSASLYGNATNSGGTIGFTVDRASSKPSTIKLSNVMVKIDRTIPETNYKPYKIIVWGSAIAENFGNARDEFQVPGIMADYVKVISSAEDKSSVLTQDVRVTIGETYYTVNGVTYDMDAAAYISPSSHSTMVPVRFIANAFGIRDSQVIWDGDNKAVTIIHPTKVIQFTADSQIMLVGGAKVTMYSPDGLPVKAEIKGDPGHERMYIPFRALGEAFGIKVEWKADTQTAIYSPSANSDAAATVSTATK